MKNPLVRNVLTIVLGVLTLLFVFLPSSYIVLDHNLYSLFQGGKLYILLAIVMILIAICAAYFTVLAVLNILDIEVPTIVTKVFKIAYLVLALAVAGVIMLCALRHYRSYDFFKRLQIFTSLGSLTTWLTVVFACANVQLQSEE